MYTCSGTYTALISFQVLELKAIEVTNEHRCEASKLTAIFICRYYEESFLLTEARNQVVNTWTLGSHVYT